VEAQSSSNEGQISKVQTETLFFLQTKQLSVRTAFVCIPQYTGRVLIKAPLGEAGPGTKMKKIDIAELERAAQA
jgi:hypothetical protein